jgi:hypothetical protein
MLNQKLNLKVIFMYIKTDTLLYNIIQFFLNNLDNFIELTGIRNGVTPTNYNGRIFYFKFIPN